MLEFVFQQMSDEILRMVAVISTVLAVLQIFFGYKLIHFWISMLGFLAGFAAGAGIASAAVSDPAYLPILIGVAAGAVCALLMYKLYLVGLFLYCGIMALSAVTAVPFPNGGIWGYLAILICLIAFIGAGMLAVRFERPLIIVLTAVSGSVSAVNSLRLLSDRIAQNSSLAMIVGAALIGGGILIQFLSTKDKRTHASAHRKKSRSKR